MPETSVIIRAYNEEKHLPAFFDGLDKQRYRDFETIVVDSGSFDATREIARARASRLVEISHRDFTFGHSLNTGIRHSEGLFIAIVSAHTIPVNDEWLANLVMPLHAREIAMVYGRQMGVRQSKFGEFQDFQRAFGLDRKTLRPPDFMANNANSAVRRELWDVHPFDETLLGLEDIEWAKHWMERGYQVLYEPNAGIYHIHDESWPQVRRRFYRENVVAKWIGIRGRRDVPREIWRETKYFIGDVAESLRQGRLREVGAEIGRFRMEKLAGTITGIWDGAAMASPVGRQKYLFNREFKAVVIEGPGRASLVTKELPTLRPSEVLIKVAYDGICGTDLEIFEGSLGYYKSGRAKYPITPGHEFSGRIVEVGPNIANLHEGDRVVAECIQGCGECGYCHNGQWTACQRRQEVGVIGLNGAYAEYVIVPGVFVHRVPDHISLRAAALCEPLAVVLKGLKRLAAGWKPDQLKRCAVIGGGPIGYLCAQVLAHQGHQACVFDRQPARLAYYQDTPIEGRSTLADLGEFDAVVEATGNPEALETVLRSSRTGSTVLLLGFPYASREFNFEDVVASDKAIVGSVGSSAAEFKEALGLLPQLRVDCLLQKHYPLEQFQDAWAAFRQQTHLKVQIAVDDRRE